MRICNIDNVEFSDRITSISWHPGGRYCAIGCVRGPIYLWDARRARAVATVKQDFGVASLDWSPDGKHLAVLDARGLVFLFNPHELPLPGEMWRKTFLCDANTIGRAMSEMGGRESRGVPQGVSWDPSGHNLLIFLGSYMFLLDVHVVCSKKVTNNSHIWHAVWSPRGDQIASCDDVVIGEDFLHFGRLNVATNLQDTEICVASRNLLLVYALRILAWSPDCQKLACATRDLQLQVWNTRSLDERDITTMTIEHYATSMAWSPDSRHLALGREGSVVTIIDSLTMKEIALFRVAADHCPIATWSPDGAKIIVASVDGMHVLGITDAVLPDEKNYSATVSATAASLASDVIRGAIPPNVLADFIDDHDCDVTGYQVQHLRWGNLRPAGYWLGHADESSRQIGAPRVVRGANSQWP